MLAPPDPVTTTRKLSYYIFFTNNTIGPQTSAEIRKGAPGVAGPLVAPLAVGNPISGTVSLTSTVDLASGQLYVNIATAPIQTAELRGQILPGGGCFSATLSGRNENPAEHQHRHRQWHLSACAARAAYNNAASTLQHWVYKHLEPDQ